MIVQSVPLHRVGKPSDIAGITLLLAGPAGTYITGTVIPVDGGTLVKPTL
jgi:NAD(P)-dependent dehydrogenase (short-subunit alcohol dehydrogenase family)